MGKVVGEYGFELVFIGCVNNTIVTFNEVVFMFFNERVVDGWCSFKAVVYEIFEDIVVLLGYLLLSEILIRHLKSDSFHLFKRFVFIFLKTLFNLFKAR